MDNLHIQKVLSGDTESFRYFIMNYKDLAFSVALSVVKDEFWAEEVVQESFIKVFNSLKSFKGKSSFKTWLYRIVINEAFQRLRDEKKEHVYSDKIREYDLDDVDDGFKGLNLEEQEVVVQKALKLISAKESLVLRLFYFDGHDNKTISDETGWSEANVRVILYRARKSLLAVIQEMINKNIKVESYGQAK
ncbi:RNA polymerase sigma factor [Sunxiuqinia sp. A32]|uniref:RNA polymerase sigma factor n=1 Tax=Sunxiuqinia sp. A32 TaxID=3461496 RepID=UPI004045E594